MHTAPLVKIDALVSEPELNETQRKLARILAYWGDDGARHLTHESDIVGTVGECKCIYDAYRETSPFDPWSGRPREAVKSATAELFPGKDYHQVSASGFENARAVVCRAIELAGESITLAGQM